MEMLLLNLPKDMILFIVLKLPASSLIRLKFVCKYFWNLITNPSFVKMHIDHQLNIDNPRFQFLLSSSRVYSLNILNWFSGDDYEIVEMPFPCGRDGVQSLGYSCNGLLCIQTFGKTSYIWNPTTNELRKLPSSDPGPAAVFPRKGEEKRTMRTTFDWRYFGFGYDPNNDDYKVIKWGNIFTYRSHSATSHSSTSRVVIKVYTLRTNSWRTIPDDQNPFISYHLGKNQEGVLLNGALHWIVMTIVRNENGIHPWDWDEVNIIVSWDVEDEEFREVPKPTFFDRRDAKRKLQMLKDRLCVIFIYMDNERPTYMDNKRPYMDLWVMNDYGVKDSWTKLFRVELQIPYRPRRDHHPVISICENGEILIIENCDLLFYDPNTGKVRFAECTASRVNKSITTYVESLVSISPCVDNGHRTW